MVITEVRITLRDDAKLKAFASITLDDCFVIRDLKIIKGQTGMFVAMPARKRPDAEYQDIAHPINNSTRKWMEDIVLKAYKDELRKQRGDADDTGVRSTLFPPPPGPLQGRAQRELEGDRAADGDEEVAR